MTEHPPEQPRSQPPGDVAGGSSERFSQHLVPPKMTQKERDLFGRVPKDRRDWSHRKGEPRTFALLWMIYLMGASLLMVSSIAAVQTASPGVVRPAARAMILSAAVGVFVLWPMIRLSQLPPRRTKLGAVFADAVVILPPIAALTLPQTLRVLSAWPFSVVLAVLAAFAAWIFLVGVLLAFALRTLSPIAERDGSHRVLWTVVFLLIAMGGPTYSIFFGGGSTASESPLQATLPPGAGLSPISLISDMVRDRQGVGRSAAIGSEHWIAILRTAALASALWAAGLAAKLARPRRTA